MFVFQSLTMNTPAAAKPKKITGRIFFLKLKISESSPKAPRQHKMIGVVNLLII
jgi:hypothetical protein